jgi:membrane associated rhomboid family serine protease
LSLRPKRTAVLVVVGVMLNVDQQLNTAWQAHLGGGLVGLAFGIGLIVRAIVEKRYGPTDPRDLQGPHR